MAAERGPEVGIDATPLVSAHATRGIGRHLARTLEAAGAVAPSWVEHSLGTLVVSGQVPPLQGPTWCTRRSPIRPQDLDPLIAAVADRLALRGRRPRLWHHTDPLNPFSPLPPRRTIASVYDAIPIQDPDVWDGIRPHRRYAYRRYLDMVRTSRGVIASLDSTASDIAAIIGIPADRIAVVPPYVRRLADPGPTLPSTPSPDAACRFVFVGVLEQHKRAELAVDVIAELVRRGEPATLTFIDARPPHRRAAVERHAARLGVSTRVRFVGRLEDAALDAVYARSTLLATSRVEGFGQPPVEAILAGGRVLAVPIAAYLETVGGLATFSTDATPGALADAALAAPGPPDETARSTLMERFGAAAATEALRATYDRFGPV